MHKYHTGPSAAYPPTPSPAGRTGGIRAGDTTEEEDDEAVITRGEGDEEQLIGGMEGAKSMAEEEGGVPGMGDDDGIVLGRLGSSETIQSEQRKPQPWAHRDIKPVSDRVSSSGLHLFYPSSASAQN